MAFFDKPEGVEEWTVPITSLTDAPESVRLAFYRANPYIVVDARDSHPDAFRMFVAKYGQGFADEVISLAEGAA